MRGIISYDTRPHRTIRYHAGPYWTIWAIKGRGHNEPYRLIWAHTGTYKTIPDHRGSSGTIQDDTRPYKTIWDHTVPYGSKWNHTEAYKTYGTIWDNM